MQRWFEVQLKPMTTSPCSKGFPADTLTTGGSSSVSPRAQHLEIGCLREA